MTIRIDITLDEARDAFEASVTTGTISAYQIAALTYWRDDMISDETFGEIVRVCTHALARL